MSDVVSLAEIRECYAGQWVVVGNPQTSGLLELLAGRVLHYSRSRDRRDMFSSTQARSRAARKSPCSIQPPSIRRPTTAQKVRGDAGM